MIHYTIVVNNAVSDLFFCSCLTETNHLRLNYALNSVQSVAEVPEVHISASVNGK